MLFRVRLAQIILIALLIQPVSAAPSPDFDESGVVDITDFLLFVSVFGSREGQERYDAKYDLNGDGEIGIGDFLLFCQRLLAGQRNFSGTRGPFNSL